MDTQIRRHVDRQRERACAICANLVTCSSELGAWNLGSELGAQRHVDVSACPHMLRVGHGAWRKRE